MTLQDLARRVEAVGAILSCYLGRGARVKVDIFFVRNGKKHGYEFLFEA